MIRAIGSLLKWQVSSDTPCNSHCPPFGKQHNTEADHFCHPHVDEHSQTYGAYGAVFFFSLLQLPTAWGSTVEMSKGFYYRRRIRTEAQET